MTDLETGAFHNVRSHRLYDKLRVAHIVLFQWKDKGQVVRKPLTPIPGSKVNRRSIKFSLLLVF